MSANESGKKTPIGEDQRTPDIVDVGELIERFRLFTMEKEGKKTVRAAVERMLIPILAKWGLAHTSNEHRMTIARLRSDSLYATVIIEYIQEGDLAKQHKFYAARRHLKKHIKLIAKHNPQAYRQYLGILLDGCKIAFIRYAETGWEEPYQPHDFNADSLLMLVEAIQGLRRRALFIPNLLESFGSAAAISQAIIRELYKAITNAHSPRTILLFEEWKRVFSQVCAYAPKKMEGLTTYYKMGQTLPDNTKNLGPKQAGESIDVEKLMFAVHTYYSFLVKLTTAEIVLSFSKKTKLGSYLHTLEEAYTKDPRVLGKELANLEEGQPFRNIGIQNFLELDYFAWYIEEWNAQLATALDAMLHMLRDYDFSMTKLSPERVVDLFKRLYQDIVPPPVRHDLGEFFTPDWLAELLLDEIGYDGDTTKSILDPTCGSGTFLVLTIKRFLNYADNHLIAENARLPAILKNIRGFDLNPLAVQASKANYLIQIASLLSDIPGKGITIPVYLADSIFVNRRKNPQGFVEVVLSTTEGDFVVPAEILKKKQLPILIDIIEKAVQEKNSEESFQQLWQQHAISLKGEEQKQVTHLFGKISSLHQMGKGQIWTRLLKNAFTPLFAGQFDFVCGNPPWVNWESLPPEYRDNTKNIWLEYLLFPKKSGKSMGKTKRDLAMLFTARCLDKYVKKDGRFGFIIPYTCFKSQAGGGFRKFLTIGRIRTRYLKGGGAESVIPVTVEKVHDLVELYPFEGAITRTSMFVIAKAGKTEFPIPCTIWHNPGSQGISMDLSLGEVQSSARQTPMLLTPINSKNNETPWMVGTRESFTALQPFLKGPSSAPTPVAMKQSVGGLDRFIKRPAAASKLVPKPAQNYQAHAGVVTLFNQIYWIDLLPDEGGKFLVPNPLQPDQRTCVKITNPVRTGQKKSAEVITDIVEKDVVYPLIRGKEVKRWYCTSDVGYILLPVDATGECYSHQQLLARYPNSYDYFSCFFNELVNRNGQPYKNKLEPFRTQAFEKAEKIAPPFYWLFNVGPALAPFKVVWKYIAGKITGKARLSSAVVEPITNEIFTHTTVVPNEKLMIVEVQSREEAHYLASILNSTFCRLLVASYVIETAISTHILKEINILRFDPKKPAHRNLVALSKWMHAMAKQMYEYDRPELANTITELEDAVDQETARMYGISDQALRDVEDAFHKLFGEHLEEGGAGDEEEEESETGEEIEEPEEDKTTEDEEEPEDEKDKEETRDEEDLE